MCFVNIITQHIICNSFEVLKKMLLEYKIEGLSPLQSSLSNVQLPTAERALVNSIFSTFLERGYWYCGSISSRIGSQQLVFYFFLISVFGVRFFFLIAPFPDRCLLVPCCKSRTPIIGSGVSQYLFLCPITK